MATPQITFIWTALNNREKAQAIWLLIFIAWCFRNEISRGAVYSLIRTFFQRPIITSVALMLCYIFLMILGLYRFGYWIPEQSVDTVIWALTAGFVMLLNSNSIGTDKNYFKETALDTIKLTAIVDFLLHLYVFSFLIELILVPSLLFLGLVLAISNSYKQLASLKKPLSLVIGLIVLILIARSLYMMLAHFSEYKAPDLVKNFALVPLLTLVYLPFIYFIGLYSRYENVFVRLSFLVRSPDMLSYAKYRVAVKCNYKFSLINRVSRELVNLKFDSKESFNRSIDVLLLKTKKLNPS